jgi:hypothetical protein
LTIAAIGQKAVLQLRESDFYSSTRPHGYPTEIVRRLINDWTPAWRRSFVFRIRCYILRFGRTWMSPDFASDPDASDFLSMILSKNRKALLSAAILVRVTSAMATLPKPIS